MPRPLQPDDPSQLGQFRLSERLWESPIGIVYLGSDLGGRSVTVALLTTGAAGDAAARDRFRSAIMAASGSAATVGDAAPVVAAEPDGVAPWVATEYLEGRAGAERFFEAVALRRGLGWRRGPQFAPYWASDGSGPAVQSRTASAIGIGRIGGTRSLATAVLSLAALLVVLVGLAVVLYQCEPKLPDPPPASVPLPTVHVPLQSSTPDSGSPVTPSPSPSPCSSVSASPRPSPSQRPSPGKRSSPSPKCPSPSSPPPGDPGGQL